MWGKTLFTSAPVQQPFIVVHCFAASITILGPDHASVDYSMNYKWYWVKRDKETKTLILRLSRKQKCWRKQKVQFNVILQTNIEQLENNFISGVITLQGIMHYWRQNGVHGLMLLWTAKRQLCIFDIEMKWCSSEVVVVLRTQLPNWSYRAHNFPPNLY